MRTNTDFYSHRKSLGSPLNGDVMIYNAADSILKAVMPQYLFKPPFGYPRPIYTYSLRSLAKTAYVFPIIKTIADEISSTDWTISMTEEAKELGMKEDSNLRYKYINFLKNPNINDDSFQSLLRQAVFDLCEIGNAVWVKCFNPSGQLVELYAKDGASFLKNPDVYGTYHKRVEFVEPLLEGYMKYNAAQQVPPTLANLGAPEGPDAEALKQKYSYQYAYRAAYFQYGINFAAFPIPFGTREVVYMELNPRTDRIYGYSPVEMLADIVLTLVYGSKYNLDFYLNNNTPEGIVEMLGAKQEDINSMSARLAGLVRSESDVFGIKRRQNFRIAVTPNPVKFTPFQMKPIDMQILEQQKWFYKIVLACFGVNENEMGITEDSNKSTGQVQNIIHKRKALKPFYDLLAHYITTQILAEFEELKGYEFRWKEYDLDEDIKKHALYEAQIRMGIKTSEMVAKELGINTEELFASKQKQMKENQANMNQGMDTNNFEKGDPNASEKVAKEEIQINKEEKKSITKENNEDKNEIKDYIKEVFGTLLEEVDKLEG